MSRFALILLLLPAACGRSGEVPHATTAPPPDRTAEATAPVRTDRSSYRLTPGPSGPEATIVTTFQGPADRSVYLENCNGAIGVTLQRKVGQEWVYAWMVAMNACLSEPIEVPPGGEHSTSLYLHENAGGVSYPPGARMIESGTYRMVWSGVITSYDLSRAQFGPELPLEERVSEPFTIEVP
jgi:hypothetical protein